MISVTGITPRYSTGTGSTGTTGTNGTSNNSNSSTSDAITNAAGGAMDQNAFVKLLVTQMQNQDPLNPMDGKDLAAQLAQFSSVEQLMNINSKMDTLTAAVNASKSSSSTGSSAV